MGEIADALRRANAELDSGHGTRRRDGARTHGSPDTGGSVYQESLRRHEAEQPSDRVAHRTQRAAASPAAPADRKTEVAPPSRAPELPLTRYSPEAQAPQAVLLDAGGVVTDACIQLALRVRKRMADLDARSVAVVSGLRGEGKTTVSCNLALALSSLSPDRKIALVDLDLRRPSLLTVLELGPPGAGIEDVLCGKADLGSVRVGVVEPALDVYPCLRGQLKAHEILLRPSFGRVVEDLEAAYETVIFDSPPTLLVPDSTIMLQHVKCFAPVARSGITRTRAFRKMIEALPRNRMLGPIMDGTLSPVRSSYYEPYEADVKEATD